jgi:uncharacterized protein (DUF58 family)
VEIRTSIRLKRQLVPIIFGISVFLSIIDDFQGWRFLVLVLGSIWLLSFLWVQSMSKNLQLRREMRFGWAQVGDRLEERFTLINTGLLTCIWIEVKDHSNLPGYQASVVAGVDAKARKRWRTKGLCSQRGLFNLGPTSIITADPFGIYQVEKHYSNQVNLMVTPPIIPLPEIQVAPGGRAGEGAQRLYAPQPTVSAAGVREYTPGDNLKWIHWRTSARRDDLFVRLFDNTPAGDWWIVLDVDHKVQSGHGSGSTEEHGVILAASLADQGLRGGKAVGLAASGLPLVWLPPKEGDGQRWEILRALALLEPAQQSLSKLLLGIKPTLGRNTSLVIITPNYYGFWLESLFQLLWRGVVPTILLLDPVTFGSNGNSKRIQTQLSDWNIHYYLITPDLMNKPEAFPGSKGKWEWRFSPTGRAISVLPPSEINWKVLT